MKTVTEEGLNSFWEDYDKYNNPKLPFTALMRKQVLEQLTNQFKIDPKTWKIVLYSYEGHYHTHKAFRKTHLDRVENFSSDLVNRKTGEKLSCWVDFVTYCQGKGKETYEACPHASPSDCEIKFYVRSFDGKYYDSDSTLVRSFP